MRSMPLEKIGGQALIIGQLAIIVSFVLQFLAGGSADEDKNILEVITTDISGAGITGAIAMMLSGFGLALSMVGFWALADRVRPNLSADGTLQAGLILALIGSVGLMISGSGDRAGILGTEAGLAVEEVMSAQAIGMNAWVLSGPVLWLGIMFLLLAAGATSEFGGKFTDVVTFIAGIVAVFYVLMPLVTLGNIDNINTIFPLWAGIVLGSLIFGIWGILAGRKLMSAA